MTTYHNCDKPEMFVGPITCKGCGYTYKIVPTDNIKSPHKELKTLFCAGCNLKLVESNSTMEYSLRRIPEEGE